MASVSTFQDHNAIPAALVAARSRHSCCLYDVRSRGDMAAAFGHVRFAPNNEHDWARAYEQSAKALRRSPLPP